MPEIRINLPHAVLIKAGDYADTTNEHKPEACSRDEAIQRLVEIGLAVAVDKHPADVAEWVANGGLSDIDAADIEPE